MLKIFVKYCFFLKLTLFRIVKKIRQIIEKYKNTSYLNILQNN